MTDDPTSDTTQEAIRGVSFQAGEVTGLPTAESNQQQTCKACGHQDKFDFHVPSDLWKRVVPSWLRNRVVCLYCFDEFAHERNIDYAASLRTLHFAGKRAALEFRIVRAISQPRY